MKTSHAASWSLTFVTSALLFGGGCVRESVSSAPVIVTNESSSASAAASPVENPPPQAAVQDLENAPAVLVSTPAAVPAAASLASPAAEVARLAQSGVDESVMLAFVNNSGSAFNLGADQLIYLNDIGVPGNVVTAMIQRDQVLKTTNPAPSAPAPDYAYQPAPTPNTVPETEAAPAVAQDAPLPQANVTDTYFHDTLSPYGNWIDVEGYGRCWQPSVVVVDRGWTPYCDRGHWVFTDCGWYWASDYSWGWAPFHYGRWFRHNIWGWCWAPDTVWGPSWVSWRYNAGYCGWAPLPPTACFRPGIGFTYFGRPVGVGFEFGLTAGSFTFVAAERFCDPQPFHYRIPHQRVTQIFSQTTIVNPVVEDREHPRYHRGIPPKQIADAAHVEIRPVKVQETDGVPSRGRGENLDRSRGTLTVFHPALPQPPAHVIGNRIGEGVKPATPATVLPRLDADSARQRAIPRNSKQISSTPETRSERAPAGTEPVVENNQAGNPNGRGKASGSILKNEISNGTLVSREPAPAPTRALPKRQPVAASTPQYSSPAPAPVQPAVRDGTYRVQPRQENEFSPAPSQAAPAVREYQNQPESLQESRRAFVPAPQREVPNRVPTANYPPSAREVVPQVVAPRVEAPQVEWRSAPSVPAARAPSNNDGKRQDGGNPRNNR